MYERFTDRSRKVMQLAQQEAQRFYHGYVGTEHVLCAMIREGRGVAAWVLKNLGLDLSKIRSEVERHVQAGADIIVSNVPLTPLMQNVLRHAANEADRLGNKYIGTEHLLLGLLSEPEGVASKVLAGLGVKLEDVRAEMLRLLGHDEASVSMHTDSDGPKGCGLSPTQFAWLRTLKQQIEEVKQQIKELEEANTGGSGFSGRLIPLQALLMQIGKAKAETGWTPCGSDEEPAIGWDASTDPKDLLKATITATQSGQTAIIPFWTKAPDIEVDISSPEYKQMLDDCKKGGVITIPSWQIEYGYERAAKVLLELPDERLAELGLQRINSDLPHVVGE